MSKPQNQSSPQKASVCDGTDGGSQRIVMKFGGTSVADPEAIERVARLVGAEADKGNGVAVVVSAMAGETDRLAALADGLSDMGAVQSQDYDMVLAAGEQVSAGLVALALRRMGFKARSWAGWQIPIITDKDHAKARIIHIPENPLGAAIDGGEIAIIAGFQGISEEGTITTLGRGGSDTSAVAIAAALKADRCDIYTDVDGVYTTDPRIEPKARRLRSISGEEMLEMASMGAGVLQTRSVELAIKEGVTICVRSSFEAPLKTPDETSQPGTSIGEPQGNLADRLEQHIITGVTPDHKAARISVMSVPDLPGRAALIFRALADASINIDMIVQAPSRINGYANISFSLEESDLARAQEILAHQKEIIGYQALHADRSVSKISVIGIGMKSHAGVAATMFEALSKHNINIHNIATSEIKISVLIEAQYSAHAVRVLHEAYGLSDDEISIGESG